MIVNLNYQKLKKDKKKKKKIILILAIKENLFNIKDTFSIIRIILKILNYKMVLHSKIKIIINVLCLLLLDIKFYSLN